MDYLEIVPSVMSYKEQLKSATLLKLRSVWLHHLSLDAKRFVTSFGETSKYKYNNEMLLEEMAQKNLVSYKEYLTKKKCSSELTLQICKSISTDRARRSFEGAVVVGSRLLIYYQVDLIKNRYKDVFTGEYSNIDKKNLMNLFGKTNNQAMSLGDFQRNNYTSKMVSGDIARDSLISELVDSTYFQSIIESREITTVGLVGVVADPSNPSTAHMKLALEFEMKVLQRADQEKLIKQLPYFWKNQVPIFGDITNHLINHSTF